MCAHPSSIRFMMVHAAVQNIQSISSSIDKIMHIHLKSNIRHSVITRSSFVYMQYAIILLLIRNMWSIKLKMKVIENWCRKIFDGFKDEKAFLIQSI